MNISTFSVEWIQRKTRRILEEQKLLQMELLEEEQERIDQQERIERLYERLVQ
ncbi:hypothetical protein ACM26V_09275 [Salipaludibacillus sp. HK11]|uniref:hypothetical protein n=1 Tax=Salipaludibacillus sp. HK11 TaxID=3394320 RepID=UPI0039FBE536